MKIFTLSKINHVKKIYDPFTPQEISKRIAELLTPEDMKAPVDIVYQSIENLHQACPNNKGDWYFTGNYPTPGGNKVVNRPLSTGRKIATSGLTSYS